jgi:ribose transport system permease protein
MKSVRRFIFRYGTFVALVVMCGVLSALTLKWQHPLDAAAARGLAGQLIGQLRADDHVVIVGRGNQEDQRFANALAQALSAANIETTQVQGTPQDARRELQNLVERGQPIAVIAGNHVTANWLLLRELPQNLPALSNCRVVQPAPYLWPTFLKAENLLNVANQISVIAIIAVGMTFVIIAGGIDLSVGSLIALSSVVAALLIRRWGGPEASIGAMLIASLAAIATCGGVGGFSGMMVIAIDIPPFIVTLAMMLVASGMAFVLAEGQSIPDLPASFTWLGRGTGMLGIPHAVLLMGVTYVLAALLLSKTVLGRHIYAVGDNLKAAWLSGIPYQRVLLFTYVASGLLAGLGGILVASTYQSGDPRYGDKYELYVIAAVVVGGTSLAGGRGTIVGTLIGAFIIGIIDNGMNLLQVNPFAQKVILGLVILGAVMLDRVKGRSVG